MSTTPTAFTADEISRALAAPMPDNDAQAETVRDYLVELLAELWRKEEFFSGKRPFGTSGWQWPVYAALVTARLVDGEFDSDGYLDDVNEDGADELIGQAIESLRAAR